MFMESIVDDEIQDMLLIIWSFFPFSSLIRSVQLLENFNNLKKSKSTVSNFRCHKVGGSLYVGAACM